MSESIILAEGGQSGYAIVVAVDAPAPVQFAAIELKRYLEKIGSVRLPLVTASRQRQVIRLRVNPAAPRLQGQGAEAFSLRTDGPRLELEGASPRAVLYAVYTLLEEYLGCGWLKPGEDVVPRLATIRLPPLDLVQAPAFPQRMLIHFPVSERIFDQIDWAAKQKLSTCFVALNHDLHLWEEEKYRQRVIPEIQRRGLDVQGFGHALFTWLPPARYFATHPEYFAVNNGVRSPQFSLCVSNPAVAREIARNISCFVKTNPEFRTITLWHNDNDAWCECPECRKWFASGERHRSFWNTAFARHLPQRDPQVMLEADTITGAQLSLVNRVAEHLARSQPQLTLEFLAYGRATPPATTVQPRSNVRVGFALFDRFIKPDDALCPLSSRKAFNHDTRRYLEGWRRQTANLYVYEYYGLLHDFSPLWDVMQRDFSMFRKLGLRGLSSEICRWNELQLYSYAKLLWRPDLSIDEMLRTYCERAYGPAAERLFAFWQTLRLAQLQWNFGQVNAACLGLEPEKWRKTQRRTLAWRQAEKRCLALLAAAVRQLQQTALGVGTPANRGDFQAVERIRNLQARWHEVECPWWV